MAGALGKVALIAVAGCLPFPVGAQQVGPSSRAPGQAAAPMPTVDLNGDWIDGGYFVTIKVDGPTVTATYQSDWSCDIGNGNKPQTTRDNFTAQLDAAPAKAGSQLKGITTVCSLVSGKCGGRGLAKASMTLKVSPDGRTLDGTWFDCPQSKAMPFSLRRSPCPGLSSELSAAADRGAEQLFEACKARQIDLDLCPKESRPYCATTSCLASDQASVPVLQSATGPGPAGAAVDFVTWLNSKREDNRPVDAGSRTPDVPVPVKVAREDEVFTKDTCAKGLPVLRKADEIMNAMNLKNDQQDQERAISCLVAFCGEHSWPTQ